MDKQARYLERIRRVFPDLPIRSSRLHTRDGQFNDILIVDDAVIFRFPRLPQVARTIALETRILRVIRPYLSLPIPDPIYSNLDPPPGELAFMGYPIIPGEPLRNEALAAVDDGICNRLATQLATFLRDLHGVPAAVLGRDLPVSDGRETWADLYARFREHLFPFMRPDARDLVTRQFAAFLDEPRHWVYRPVLRHGDFGTGNILYDPAREQIGGVIDFSSIAIGDPAVDIAAIWGCGQRFLERFYPIYPEIPSMLERAAFYRSTFALQQALYALRDGDQESFDDGIAAYV
jgi:aminoglycoside 2''-phosphotransferase